jgi:hypothetical protein
VALAVRLDGPLGSRSVGLTLRDDWASFLHLAKEQHGISGHAVAVPFVVTTTHFLWPYVTLVQTVAVYHADRLHRAQHITPADLERAIRDSHAFRGDQGDGFYKSAVAIEHGMYGASSFADLTHVCASTSGSLGLTCDRVYGAHMYVLGFP